MIQVSFQEGQRVKRGEVLARLDETTARLALDRAQAILQKAHANRERLKAMPEAAPNVHAAHVQAARADIQAAEVDVALAKYWLEQTIVRAPFDGTVLARKVEVGSLVDPRSFNVPAVICELADLTRLEVEVWVQEGDLGRVAVKQPCTVMVQADPRHTYRGVVARVLPVADRARGAVGVRVHLALPQGAEPSSELRPEMAAVVSFLKNQSGQ